MNKDDAANISKSRKFNIVFLIDGLGWGGAERLMVPILANIDRELFSVRVGVFQIRNGNPIADDLRSLGIPVDLIPVPYLRDLTAVSRIASYLKDVKADLIHAQLELGDILGGIAALRMHLPSVSTLHTMPSQDMSLKSRLHQEVEYFCLRHFFNMVISVSNEARQFHRKIGRLSDQKTCTIYNGIDLSNFPTASQLDRKIVLNEFSIPTSATVLITVAVLRELKGIQYMIRALPKILAANPDLYYLVAGSGDFQDELVVEAAQAGVSERVIFAGARKDIPALMSASDLFVLPTLTEALPTVLAEAMASYLPILACRVGGVPEMVEDGINGRLVTPADSQQLASACNEMLKQPDVLFEMGQAGRRIVEEKFNVHVQVQKLQSLYQNLITTYEK
jgi:glycosyltransferase involved in cell wall biosynthesis